MKEPLLGLRRRIKQVYPPKDKKLATEASKALAADSAKPFASAKPVG